MNGAAAGAGSLTQIIPIKSVFSVAATGSADFLFSAIHLTNKTSSRLQSDSCFRRLFFAAASLESQQCCSKLRVVALGSEWAAFAV